MKPLPHNSTEWLVGGGEMGDLIRRTDFGSTPLGPREQWQQSLRTTLRLVVESRFPMALLWGRELLMLYNDAYRVIAADRHPHALGRSVREVWPEVWHTIEPIFAAVLDRGDTVYLEDQLYPIDRKGRRENAYFTLSYSPVRTDEGAIAGCLVTLLETTRRVEEQEALRAERNHVTEAAARERELLAGVLEHVPVMITIYDPHLAAFHLNAETRRVLGWTDDDANTGDLLALCYPDPSLREEVQRFMEPAEPGWREFVVTAKDGKEVPSLWANVRLSDRTQIGIGLDLRERKRAENELRESAQQLLALYEHNPAMVVLSDLDDGRIIRANAGFSRMLGFAVEEAQGRTPVELGVFPSAEDRQRIVNDVRAQGFVRDLEVTILKKSGAPAVGLLSSTVIESGGKKHLVTVVNDITERKNAEAALRASEERNRRAHDLLKGITEATKDLVAAVDTDFRFIAFNAVYEEAFEQVFGRRIEIGTCLLDALAHLPDDRQRAVDLWRRALEGETVVETQEFGDPLRARRFFDLRFGPIRDASGTVIGAGEFASDVTERVQGEQALREAKLELEEADRRKNEFLAVLSHELRNPLAPIRNSIYIMEHTAPGGEQASHARQVIDRQAQHMARLIDDLLDVTRISRGKITLQRERMDLNAVARGTAEDHREVFARNGVELEIDVGGEPVWVDGDRTRLAQVVGNLLSNSAKFTPRGGRTTLSIDATPHGRAVLRVRDDGAGMSEETLRHLFEPFVQAAQTLDRTRGGLGLGLSLVKGLVEMHGGDVTAWSAGEGQGSEFTVTLPVQARARPRPSTVPDEKRSSDARRVLVVEDNADAAESLRDALELGDHEVAIAYTGPEGVEAARSYKPDVVLCDIGLPGLDGCGVARAIREDPDPRVRSAYLVALSGYALAEDVIRSKEAGFDRHIAKPPSIEAIEKLLHEARPARGG